MRSFDASLLSTVYWSLGTLVVIVAVLIGLGWFANFRVYQRDLEGIKRELDALAAKNIAELKAALESSLRNGLATAKKELEQALSERIESVSRSVLILRAEFHRFAFDMRTDKKNYSMATTSAIRLLDASIELKWDGFINSALTGLVSSIDNGGGLTLLELRLATDLLMGLSDSYAVLRDRAKAALAKAKTFG